MSRCSRVIGRLRTRESLVFPGPAREIGIVPPARQTADRRRYDDSSGVVVVVFPTEAQLNPRSRERPHYPLEPPVHRVDPKAPPTLRIKFDRQRQIALAQGRHCRGNAVPAGDQDFTCLSRRCHRLNYAKRSFVIAHVNGFHLWIGDIQSSRQRLQL
jgi:hypothetical protein